MTFSFNPTAEDFCPVGNQAETLEFPDPEHTSMYDDAETSEVERGGQYAITAYLKENGWESSKGDTHFNKQRRVADEPTEKDARFFYNMMHKIGRDMNKATRAFDLSGIKNPALLDMCMAPGAFVAQVLDKYPNARVRTMSLPLKDGGHRVRLGHHNVAVEFRDITMLAADIGMQMDDVPTSGPDPGNLEFTKVFSDSERFDLVLCDGAVRRTHQRTAWRERREATRLTLTQLAIGLEHLNNGGTMVILLHKLDSWPCFSLIHNFSKFSTVQLFKHPQYHKLRSSFYLVAKNIQADSTPAKTLVLEWKERYKIATVGTEEGYSRILQVRSQDAQAALNEFGEEFIAMGRKIWKLQAEALAKASFMKAEDESQCKGNESEGIGQQDMF
ncbi:FtsJ domain-containing protein [Fusarium falciforme]|uniref:FtsJ domain-containing protein n=1 Tax=Fusarium falciforme TaxID=195108 RepID=UPI002301D860|nr:FtsJ domain-containing protein [Fusarium falciforme]WAO89910.1 FtsJ domain-containing protein [Fusarium falciforme]